MQTFKYRLRGRVYDLPTRDSQRGKLYAAERAAFSVSFYAIVGDGSLAAVEKVVRRIESSETWKKLLVERYGYARGRLDVSWAHSGAWGTSGQVRFSRASRSLPIILHEMSHAARSGARHNWPFAEAYLRLVSRFIGVKEAAALKAAFKARGVRWTPKKTFSPEVREKLRQRGLALAAMRRANLVTSGVTT